MANEDPEVFEYRDRLYSEPVDDARFTAAYRVVVDLEVSPIARCRRFHANLLGVPARPAHSVEAEALCACTVFHSPSIKHNKIVERRLEISAFSEGLAVEIELIAGSCALFSPVPTHQHGHHR